MAGLDLKEKVGPVPKWLILVLAIVVLLCAGYFIFKDAFFPSGQEAVPEAVNQYPTVPDPENRGTDNSATRAFEEQQRNDSSASDFWKELAGDDHDPGRGGHVMPSSGAGDDLDPSVYSEVERKLIRSGLRSRESIDEDHRRKDEQERREREDEAARRASAPRQLTSAQQDSQYFARLEKAMQISSKYSAQMTGVSPAPESAPAPEPEPSIDIDALRSADGTGSMPVDALQGDGIITSLEDDPKGGAGPASSRANSFRPVKATFLKDGKITSGNRVIIRLLEDLTLSDGMVIPANTHITGYCNFRNRLKIDVNMLHYNGRMFPVHISVYDNDGTEGLYCPLALAGKKKGKAAEQAARNTLQSAGNIVGSLLMNNPFLGSMTSSNISAISGTLGDDGVITVNVTSGYEFYVYEAPEKKSGSDGKG